MSDGPVSDGPGRSGVGRWLTSRKNLAGMAGALVGSGLAFADVGSWPLVAVALYGVGALLAPADPPEREPRLTDQLRVEVIPPSDVTGALIWLLSDSARHVTGHCLAVDGGALAR